MKLSEKINRALAKKNLEAKNPKTPTPQPQEEKKPQPTPKAQYVTVPEGFKHLSNHSLDEDGLGFFTAQKLGMEQIKLPMRFDDYIIEDIQRAKTGIIHVQFAKSEGKTE